ncbi:hypothetical protein OH77DRAFT_1250902 [Trametes cingulata]|nr:hypothetical protein OH77DRAFT_1250902 [Trametes cingulata]
MRWTPNGGISCVQGAMCRAGGRDVCKGHPNGEPASLDQSQGGLPYIRMQKTFILGPPVPDDMRIGTCTLDKALRLLLPSARAASADEERAALPATTPTSPPCSAAIGGFTAFQNAENERDRLKRDIAVPGSCNSDTRAIRDQGGGDGEQPEQREEEGHLIPAAASRARASRPRAPSWARSACCWPRPVRVPSSACIPVSPSRVSNAQHRAQGTPSVSVPCAPCSDRSRSPDADALGSQRPCHGGRRAVRADARRLTRRGSGRGI